MQILGTPISVFLGRLGGKIDMVWYFFFKIEQRQNYAILFFLASWEEFLIHFVFLLYNFRLFLSTWCQILGNFRLTVWIEPCYCVACSEKRIVCTKVVGGETGFYTIPIVYEEGEHIELGQGHFQKILNLTLFIESLPNYLEPVHLQFKAY